MSKRKPRARRRRDRCALPPGVHMVQVVHDRRCNAPLFPCTCDPEVTLVRHVSPGQLAEDLRAQQRWLNGIRKRVS